MRVYLLEPYFTGSHRQWAEGLRDHSAHEIHLVTHEGQFWKWRLAGGFVTMAESLEQAITEHGPADLLLGTSLLDLAGLLGLARSAAASTPAALYLHENQVTYPATARTRVEARHGLACWTSLLASDGAAFNSEYHRAILLDSLPGLLASFPDRRHDHLIPIVRERSVVIPVGVDLARLDPPDDRDGPATILWNHRWDPDKGLAVFLQSLAVLAAAGLEFRVVLAGESFVSQPDEHAAAIAALGTRVLHAGFLPEADYVDALRRADVVVSTARQEFFGISVVEAMYAGAMPILPDRLVYPERIPARLRDRCLYRSESGLVSRLRWAIENVREARRIGAELAETVARFDWSVVGPQTDAWLEAVATR